MSEPLQPIHIPTGASRFDISTGDGFVQWFKALASSINVQGVEILNRIAPRVIAEFEARRVPTSIETFDGADVGLVFLDQNDQRTAIELDLAGRPSPRFASAMGQAGGFASGVETFNQGLVFTDSSGTIIPDLQFKPDGTFAEDVVDRFGSRLRVDSKVNHSVGRQIRALPADSTALLTTSLNNSVKFMLNTWIPTRFPGTDPITTLGGNEETQVRHPTAAAFSIAAAIYTGMYNSTATGVSLAAAKTSLLRVIRGVTLAHASNTPGGWREGWQPASWVQTISAAAWLIWADVPEDLRAMVLNMQTNQANRFNNRPAPYWTRYDGVQMTPGDSQAESNAWDGGLLAFAPLMQPTAPNAALWTARAHEYMQSAGAAPNDILQSRIVQGVNMGTAFDGWNINQDGTIVNHDRIHPDYMCSMPELAWSAGVLWALGGKRIPDSFVMNAELIYAGLSEVQFDKKTIYTPGTWELYYPEGNDWGTHRMADKAMADVVAHCMGLDSQCSTPAAEWAKLHLQRCVDLQTRSTTGQTYIAASEDVYPGREPWVARNLALAALATRLPTTTRYTYAPIGA